MAKAEKRNATPSGDGKKKKDKGSSKPESNPGFGTARGIESMFRNGYRAQLDMIALAATKSNIMISVNSSLFALLTLTSAYMLNSQPQLLIPMAIFLLTCIVSVFFAVLAARPQRAAKVKMELEDFREGHADLLVFEYFAKLTKEDYMTMMTELMQDKDRVYTAMVAHLYFLGRSADRSFMLLRVSYTAFIVGLIASFIAFAVAAIAF